MNRFTKDMATIDDMLPLVLFDLIQVFTLYNILFQRLLKKNMVHDMNLPNNIYIYIPEK